MNTTQFQAAYGASRNGTDNFHFNPLYRRFHYSDGVKECAEAGCYWLLDILGTELPAVFRKNLEATLMSVSVKVGANRSVTITGAFADDQVDYKRKVAWSDLPAGQFNFLVSNDGDGILRCILLTEY